MQLSIIIPTINRYEDLINTIGYLKDQSFTDYEILVIDQTDDHNRQDISNLDSRIRYFTSKVKSASAARNFGIQESKGVILLFLDDDVIIDDPKFLDHHLSAYADKDIPGVAGSILELRVNQQVTFERGKLSKSKENGWLFFPQNYGKEAYVKSGRSCNLSVKREFAISVGGMDERFTKGAHREEADFCYRVANKYGMFYFSPKARLTHIGNATGGIRSWTSSRVMKAQHHFDGAMYFIFKNIPFKFYPVHLFATLFFFFYRKELILRPVQFLRSIFRFLKGCINARRMIKQGPKYLTVEVNQMENI